MDDNNQDILIILLPVMSALFGFAGVLVGTYWNNRTTKQVHHLNNAFNKAESSRKVQLELRLSWVKEFSEAAASTQTAFTQRNYAVVEKVAAVWRKEHKAESLGVLSVEDAVLKEAVTGIELNQAMTKMAQWGALTGDDAIRTSLKKLLTLMGDSLVEYEQKMTLNSDRKEDGFPKGFGPVDGMKEIADEFVKLWKSAEVWASDI